MGGDILVRVVYGGGTAMIRRRDDCGLVVGGGGNGGPRDGVGYCLRGCCVKKQCTRGNAMAQAILSFILKYLVRSTKS